MFQVGAFAFAVIFTLMAVDPAVADNAVKPDLSPAPINPAIHVSRGDSWIYDIRDDVTGDMKGTVRFEVTKVTDTEIETQTSLQKLAVNAETTSTSIFDTRWRVKDNGKIVYRPYLDTTGVPADLQVGKSWSFKYEALRKGSSLTHEFSGVGKVEAWERVTLPSGSTYETFKIDVTLASASTGDNRKHEAHSIMWFSPAVNRLVKRIDESRENGKLRDATEQTLREYKPALKT